MLLLFALLLDDTEQYKLNYRRGAGVYNDAEAQA